MFASCANPKGLVVVLHGRAQTFHEYHQFTREMNANGYAVFSFDRRSQGKSDRYFEPGQTDHHIPDFQRQVTDVEEIMDVIVKQSPLSSLPKFLVAHSMGGAEGLLHLSKNQSEFNAAAFLAPMWGIGMHPRLVKNHTWLTSVIRGLNMTEKKFRKSNAWSLEMEASSYGRKKINYPTGRALQPTLFTRHPYLVTGVMTWGLGIEIVKACEQIKLSDIPEQIQIPVLTVLADDERLVCNDSITQVANRMPKSHLLTVDGRHQSLQERPAIREEIYHKLRGFWYSNLPQALKAC